METEVPATFWRGLGEAEFRGIAARDGLLTVAQTRRACELAGLPPPPRGSRLRVFIKEAEFEAWLNAVKAADP